MVRANLALLSVCATLILVTGSAAQEVPPAVREVQEALASADARGVLERSAERIEIALFGATRRYSRAQAGYVLEDFFREYPPVRVTPVDGAGTRNGWFASMAYAYERGSRPLRVYARFRREASSWVLSELILREDP